MRRMVGKDPPRPEDQGSVVGIPPTHSVLGSLLGSQAGSPALQGPLQATWVLEA